MPCRNRSLAKPYVERIYLTIIGYLHRASDSEIVHINRHDYNLISFVHKDGMYLPGLVMLSVPLRIIGIAFPALQAPEFGWSPLLCLNRLNDLLLRRPAECKL